MLVARNRGFRLLFSASAASNLGDGMAALALPWLAATITRDPVLIGLVAFAQRLPGLLLVLPAGVLVDRADHRRLMARADAARTALSLAIVALIAALPSAAEASGDRAAILALAGIAFLVGSAEVIRDNAGLTILPALVPRRDLEGANGQMGSMNLLLGTLIGPPLAGALIALALPVPFAANAAAFALAAVLVWAIVLPARTPVPRRAFGAELREGISWLLGHPNLRRIALAGGVANTIYLGSLALLVLVGRELLDLDAAGYGLVLSAGAVGWLLAAAGAPRLVRRLGGTTVLSLGAAGLAASYALIHVAGSPALLAMALAVQAAGAMLLNIVAVSYRQREVPPALLGRINSVHRFVAWGPSPFGALAAGALAAALEPHLGREAALRLPYLLAAILSAGLTLAVALAIRIPGPQGTSR